MLYFFVDFNLDAEGWNFQSFSFSGWLNMIYFGLVERFKFGDMCFDFSLIALEFSFEFVILVFPELSVLRIGGRISNLCNLPLMLLISVGDLNSVNIVLAMINVFIVDSFCLICVSNFDRFQLSVVSLTVLFHHMYVAFFLGGGLLLR